jgi:hypothetical protein
MNIFATATSPYLSAIWLDDLRLNKMVLETAQLLCTAHHELGSAMPGMYRPSHKNHPCAIWVRACRGNYVWALEHFAALCAEFQRRRGKQHASEALLAILLAEPPGIPAGERQEFVNCTTKKHLLTPTAAYRSYMREKWANDKPDPTFTGRGWPDWALDIPGVRSVINQIRGAAA